MLNKNSNLMQEENIMSNINMNKNDWSKDLEDWKQYQRKLTMALNFPEGMDKVIDMYNRVIADIEKNYPTVNWVWMKENI